METIKLIKLTSTLFLITFLFGCNHAKENAASKVLSFYSAIRNGNEEKMITLYKGVADLSTYYKSDTAIIEDITIVDNNEIVVKTINQFTNGFGKKFTQEIIFYLKPDSSNKLDYYIYDSKGLCGYDDNATYDFANKSGCLSDSDITDQQISKKLKIADEIIIQKSIDVYLELKKYVYVVNWNWEYNYNGSASGRGFVKNASSFNLPNLKCIITYKDNQGNDITNDDCVITYDTFYAGQSKSFTFYTSYVGDASSANIKFIFDDKMIMDYVTSKECSGKEYQEYIDVKSSTIKN